MQIDKIIFSCSAEFSPFWNIQSKLWSRIGIEPICLCFGQPKIKLSERYGKVRYCQQKSEYGIDSTIIQITLSKFLYPCKDPTATWLIGDIDMLPLQSYYFINKNAETVKDDEYWHLNPCGIYQTYKQSFKNFYTTGPRILGGYDLPGHYHLAKGSTFEKLFFGTKSYPEVLDQIIKTSSFGVNNERKGFQKKYWCAEEAYTSLAIYYAYHLKKISLRLQTYNNRINRIDRIFWSETNKRYEHPYEHLLKPAQTHFVDLHCHRPFHEQEDAMMKILDKAGLV